MGTGRSKPKIPIRGIGKLLTNLPPGVRTKIEGAFVEAENLLEFHNLSVVDRQTRRRLSGLIEQPIVTLTASPFGVAARWERLDDPRITTYEVQTSSDNAFSDPSTFLTLDNQFQLDNVQGTIFIRVRGVRYDGAAGLFSETASITPPQPTVPLATHSASLVDITRTTFLSPNRADLFYVLNRLEVSPLNGSDALLAFGSCGAKAGVKSTVPAVPRPDQFYLRILVDGEVTLEYGVQSSSSGPSAIDPLTLAQGRVGDSAPNDFLQLEAATKGGWSTAFGPVLVDLRETTKDYTDRLPRTADQSGTPHSFFSPFPKSWQDLAGALNPSLLDEAKYEIRLFSDGSGNDEAETLFLELTNFGFDIPEDFTIQGIEVSFRGDKTVATDVFGVVFTASLIDNTGSIRAFNQSPGTTTWPVSNGTVTFGGSSDLWGEAAGFWTPARINSPNFGFAVRTGWDNDTFGTVDVESTVSRMEMTVTAGIPDDADRVIKITGAWAPGSGSIELSNATINAIEFGFYTG